MHFHNYFVVREKTLYDLKRTNKKSIPNIYVFQQSEPDDISETVSTVFSIEQEDILEWGTSDAESMLFKPEETSEIQQADDSNKPLEGEQSIGESKTAQQLSLKVKHYIKNRIMRVENVQV